MSDLVSTLIGAVLSLIILSYLIGDNFFYRLLSHLLVGAGSAYIFVTAIFDVLVPQVGGPMVAALTRQATDPTKVIIAAISMLFCVLLVLKIWPRLASVGNIAIGYMLGIGAAVALGGALFGTLSTQVITASQLPAALTDNDFAIKTLLGILALGGTVATLLSFGFYRVARHSILSGVNAVGRFFLSVALGATFALVYVASASLMLDRLQAIVDAAVSAQKLFIK